MKRTARKEIPGLPAEVILTHVGADFDGLASMVCAKHFYPNARLVLTGSPDPLVREFLAMYGEPFGVETARAVDRMPLTRVVLVDVQVPSRLGDFRDRVADPQIEVHIYDHHPPTQESIQADYACIESVGATTTLLVSRLMEKRIGDAPAAPELSPAEATLFALGIYEETGSLTFPDTTPRDMRAAAWLVERGANLQVVSDYLHHTLSEAQRVLLNLLLASAEVREVHGMQVMIARADSDDYVGELAGLAHRLMDLERPDTLFVVVRMKQRVYVVGRSRELGADVGAVLERLGGGGHRRAASASVRGATAEGVVAELRVLLQEETAGALTARAIMSAPVQAIPVIPGAPPPTMGDARDLFVRYGHGVLPVVEEGRLRGMLGRRDVDKAIHHELADAPVTQYMTPPSVTVAPHTSVAEVQRQFADEQIARIPVIEAGGLVGIITRADLLAALHGDHVRTRDGGSETLERIRLLPEVVRSLLEKAGQVGDVLDLPVYAVGGFVRDVLLKVENLDLDLVVEGDGIVYAEHLARALGGRCRSHNKFGTAVVVAGDLKVDVASSRLEFYTRPAALPDVVGSTLKQDLARRDFSINAMAIRLNGPSFGRLYDFFGARRDLRDGVVRVLHSLSFIDDPTRIFRAIKFEQRYHFKMEAHTEQLLRQAISSDLLARVSPQRIREEFVQLLSEARPLPAVVRMEQLRVLRLIHPNLHLTTRVRALLEEVTAVLLRFESVVAEAGLDRWLVYFRALVSGMRETAIEEVAKRYRISTDDRRRLFLPRDHVLRLMRRLFRRHLLPSEIYRLLRPLSLEMVLYLLARSRGWAIKEKITRYLDRLRHIRPVATGAEVVAWGLTPGPAVGRALDILLDAQLDGKIHTLDEARGYLEEEEMIAAWT